MKRTVYLESNTVGFKYTDDDDQTVEAYDENNGYYATFRSWLWDDEDWVYAEKPIPVERAKIEALILLGVISSEALDNT